MDPGGPPSYAGGPAGYRGDSSSSSSQPRRPPPPPPPPPQQQHWYAIQPVPRAVYVCDPWSSSPRPPPPPPLPPQQQGYAIQPVPQQQASLPWGLGAGAGASQSSVYVCDPSWLSPPPPQPPQQQGHAIQPPPPCGLGAGAFPFGSGPPVPGLIPPLHPQFGPSLDPMVWGPSSNTSQHLDAMVAQQRPAAPTWPPQPQFGQHPPQFGPPPLQPPPPPPTIGQIRSELVRSPRTLGQLVMSPEHSAILVHQLNVHDEEMRKMVLDGFKHCAHGIMGNRQGHVVFGALLRSIQVIVGDRRYEELQIIVDAAVTPNLLPRTNDGVISLRWLITAVASSPGLSTALVSCFLRDRVMDEDGGDDLIAHCFGTLDYDVTKALVRHAIDTIDDKLKSSYGSACLDRCFSNATGDELPLFQDALVERVVSMAMGRDSNRLVQRLVDRGSCSIEFRRQLLTRLMEQVLRVSCDQYGRFVVRHCFLREEVGLQPIVLTACADLPQGDVQTLVMQFRPCLPFHRVLLRGNTEFPVEARRLALKIEALPPHIRELDNLKPLMGAVTRILADNLANLGD